MTTLQARSWALVAQRVTKSGDHSRFWTTARTAIGIGILSAILAAALAMRVLVYVHL